MKPARDDGERTRMTVDGFAGESGQKDTEYNGSVVLQRLCVCLEAANTAPGLNWASLVSLVVHRSLAARTQSSQSSQSSAAVLTQLQAVHFTTTTLITPRLPNYDPTAALNSELTRATSCSSSFSSSCSSSSSTCFALNGGVSPRHECRGPIG
ncbi:unnamed protein product [Lota lota]